MSDLVDLLIIDGQLLADEIPMGLNPEEIDLMLNQEASESDLSDLEQGIGETP